MGTIGSKLMDLRERSGLSLEQIAIAANYRGRSSVQKFFSAAYDPENLDPGVARRLARALVGHGFPPITDDDVFTLSPTITDDLKVIKSYDKVNVSKDIPIYTGLWIAKKPVNTESAHIDFYAVDLDHVVNRYWHPPSQIHVRSIYGILLRTGSLNPRFRPGEAMLLDEYVPARLGDDVCIYEEEFSDNEPGTDGALVMFATFERQTLTHNHYRSLDGETAFSLRSDGNRRVHRLLTLNDVLSGD